MAQKRSRQSYGGFVFGFILLLIISLIILIWGISTYDGAEAPPEQMETEQGEEADQEESDQEEQPQEEENRKFGDAIDELHEDEENADEDAKAEQEIVPEQTGAGRRMYKQLTAVEQEIYLVIQQTLADGEVECHFDEVACSEDELQETLTNALSAVYFDYPEYFWFNCGSQYSYRGNDGAFQIDLEMTTYDYWQYVLNKQKYIDEVNVKAQEIADEAAKLGSTYEKVKYVHDYLVTNVEYDTTALEELTKTVQKASSQQSHTVYGCLVSQLSVCDGYAKSFQMIMNLLGIESEFVIGDAGGPHTWNYILLDGENYWMDVTWDDHDRRDDSGNMAYPEGVDYGYFCITSEDLAVTHTPEEYFSIPDCTATKYNFFYQENSYLDKYSFEGLSNAIEEQRDEQIISVKFGSNEEMHRAIADLFTTNYRYGELPYVGSEKVMYSYDESHSILSLLYE